jgi:hypothetical protein
MPKKPSSKPAPTKSDVIRSMPNASAGDIIKKAKALGLTLTANHVYAVRAIDKRRGKPARLGGRGASTQAAPSKSSKRTSKTEFIRGFGNDTPAAQVVAAAKRAGVKISKAYVYRVRALRPPAQNARARGRGAVGNGRTASNPRSERRLTTLAIEIGLIRATALLDSVRDRMGE